MDLIEWLRQRWALAAGLLLALVLGARWWMGRPISHPPGQLVTEEPLQTDLPEGPRWDYKEHHFRALARFHIRARVLSRERYRFDRAAQLSPVDFCLGWGPMSDSKFLDKLDIGQSDRWWHWSSGEPPLSEDNINGHAANMHMIPATDAVRSGLLDVREGQVVTLDGYLIHADGPDGWHWQSSLSRTDTGDGACEVVWVEQVSAADR